MALEELFEPKRTGPARSEMLVVKEIPEELTGSRPTSQKVCRSCGELKLLEDFHRGPPSRGMADKRAAGRAAAPRPGSTGNGGRRPRGTPRRGLGEQPIDSVEEILEAIHCGVVQTRE
jgi:hypothetical protein